MVKYFQSLLTKFAAGSQPQFFEPVRLRQLLICGWDELHARAVSTITVQLKSEQSTLDRCT
ncbi:hypothetical protein D3C77_244140 [compost metagenome]